ncbi:MAG TPA: STAS domain-containing protein [Vicinamibacterales bacterium]|nr:STAS domain-containing protein [Vicinamibacterales bacterium]
MLRITSLSSEDDGRRLKVEGRLTADVVDELSRAARRALAASSRVVLDLADLSFADHRGLDLLRALRRDGVELAQCSQFVSTLMNGGRS